MSENDFIYKEYIPKLLKNVSVVFEIGANDGSDTEKLVKYCNHSTRFFAFEPDPRTAREIRKRDLPIRVVEKAVSNTNGETVIYQFYNKENSSEIVGTGPTSILEPIDHHERLTHLSHKAEVIVPTITLDSFCIENHILGVDFMWVDIQGSEANMILGAEETLKKTKYIFMEAMMNKVYVGQKTRDELLALLPDWEVIEEFPNDILIKNKKI